MSARRFSHPSNGIQLVDDGPGSAMTKAPIGGHVVIGLSADECRELARKIAHAEQMRRWRSQQHPDGAA